MKKTFDLARNGKPEKGTVTLAAYFLPTSATMKGGGGSNNLSTETLVLKVLRARSLRKGDMFGQNDVYRTFKLGGHPIPCMFHHQQEKSYRHRIKKSFCLQVVHTTYKFAFPTRQILQVR